MDLSGPWLLSFKVTTGNDWSKDILSLCMLWSAKSKAAGEESVAVGEKRTGFEYLLRHLIILCLGRVPQSCAMPQFPFEK